jgi:hypothetical protein
LAPVATLEKPVDTGFYLGGIMAKKSKKRAKKASTPSAAKQYTAALDKHASAMKKHTTALNVAAEAHRSMTAALKNNTAVIAATKPQKTFNEKTDDASDCISQWLMSAKGVSRADSSDPSKNMATDFRMGTPQEMQLCLEAVQTCMASKGDFYHLDTTSPKANQHLNTLLTGSLGSVVADIVTNTT